MQDKKQQIKKKNAPIGLKMLKRKKWRLTLKYKNELENHNWEVVQTSIGGGFKWDAINVEEVKRRMGEKVEMEEEWIICLCRFDLSSKALMEEKDCVLITHMTLHVLVKV